MSGTIAREPKVYKAMFAPPVFNGADATDLGDLWVDLSVPALKRKTANSPDVWVSIEGVGAPIVFTKGAVMLTPSAINIITWQAPVNCTVTNVRAYQDIGTGSTFNARKNGGFSHLVANATINATATWVDGGAVQNTAYAINDRLEVQITSVAGGPTQIAILVDFTQP